ncbi:DinB family protein [Rothia nasimurium]|uniref:DinB family protein n=1 Tax=Rothia nasimurium TaxID=85336 RepID=UPI001F36823E|nr:DinB family protein [Rothia nasimurium]
MPFTDPPLTGSEKELVLGYIRFQQEVFLRKLQGADGTWLGESLLATPLHPSSMTLAGMAGYLWF